jgi:type VI secretion system protein ImpK
MRPNFAIAVDRVFERVLDLLARIDRGESVSPETERSAVQALLNRAESELGHGVEWDLAKYALVAWTDEVLIDASWEGCSWWKEHALEWENFQTNLRASRFYLEAKKAASADVKRRDALEVFYIAVVLGFGGIYTKGEPGEAEVWARRYDFPPTLEQWLRQTSKSIILGADRPRMDNAPASPGHGAPPREGEALLMNWTFMGVILLAATGVFGYMIQWQLYSWITGLFGK